MGSNDLVTWTIYERPLDYPTGYIVRAWIASAGNVRPGVGLKAPTLDVARSYVPAGLVRLPRFHGEDPCIVETWI